MCWVELPRTAISSPARAIRKFGQIGGPVERDPVGALRDMAPQTLAAGQVGQGFTASWAMTTD